MALKSLTILKKSLHFFEKEFKKPQNISKCPFLLKKTSVNLEIIFKTLYFFKKASYQLKRATISLKMSSKSLKKLSENVFKKPRNY
jgi:hypothetical protein